MTKAYKNYKNKSNLIVTSAKKLFLTRGFTNSTMDEVAKEAGVTKQTVYRYFSSKLELFEAVMQQANTDVNKELNMQLDYKLDFRSALIMFGIGFMRFHLTEEIIGIYKLMVAESGNVELSKVFMEAGPNESFAKLIEFLQISEPGIKDCSQKSYFFINLLLSARSAVIIGRRPNLNENEIKDHVESVVDFFIKGIN